MKIENFLRQFICCGLLIALSLAASKFTLAQGQFAGDLTVTTSSGGGGSDSFVTVNGERASSGRAVVSPSEIVTSPLASARISLPRTGVVMLAPETRMSLSFAPAKISGEIRAGKITVSVLPGTTLDLRTPDGTVNIAARTDETIINVDFVDGRTRVGTLSGVATFNGVPVPAGQVYMLGANPGVVPAAAPVPAAQTAGGGLSNTTLLVLVAVAGAVGLGVALGLSGGDDDNTVPVSPNS